MKQFYHDEWIRAREEGNTEYSENCKEQYRLLVMESLKMPFRIYIEKLKAYPPIYLN